VPFGFLAAAVFFVFARPTFRSLLIGLGISLIGLLIRAWASGHIRKNAQLATSGPYAYTRNPLYFGSFLLGLGFTVGSGRWQLGILFALLFLGIYLPVMRVESRTLAELFGGQFQKYANAVPLFLPRITPYRGDHTNGFDKSLYLRYREYRAALGLLVAWCLMLVKAYYLK
jgi:protein-S-isoprenylcysteine O-methyltransferase Ste14